MLKAVVEIDKNMTEEELNVLTDNQMKKISESAVMYHKMYHVADGRINEWMEQKPQDYLKFLFQLADSSEFQRLSKRNDTIYIFNKLCEVSRQEQNEHLEPVISKFHSLEEMERIYRLTVFYLRRIELKFPKELCEDFYEIIIEWKFSPYYILAVLREKKAVYLLDSLANDIADGLRQRGFERNAEIILSTLHNRTKIRNAEEKIDE